MIKNQKLFVGLKAIILMAMMLILSTCAMFQDFLAPSDLVNAIEKRDGVQITKIETTPNYVLNNNVDIFTITCTLRSQYDVTNVLADMSSINADIVPMIPSFADPSKTTLILKVKQSTPLGKQTFSITAYNNRGYNDTKKYSIMVIDAAAYHVAVNGDDNNEGSKDAPFATIQYAIDRAVIAEIYKIYVSEGTYTNRYDNNNHCVELKAGVSVYGGWNTAFDNNDRENYPTIIHGKQSAQHVIVADVVQNPNTGIDGCIITGGNSITVGGGILFEASCTFIQNCIISNNSAKNGGGMMGVAYKNGFVSNNIFVNNTAENGGALVFTYSSSAIISNIFSNNIANDGAAILFNSDSKPLLSYNTIVSNSAIGKGAGIYIDNSTPIINNNTISNNSAVYGGGMYLWKSSPIITNNTINHNIAINGNGGGMYANDHSSPTIKSNTISYNSAGQKGGGVYVNDYSSPTITNNTINYNSASYGGGVCIDMYSSPTVKDNTIIYNNATNGSAKRGGGMCFVHSYATVINNTISYNSSASSGGGMYFDSSSDFVASNTISYNSATGDGGGMYIWGSKTTNIQNLILDNWSSNSNVVCIDFSGSKLVFISNIIGSTNNDDTHYAIWEFNAITEHTLQYNFFVTNALRFLYRVWGSGESTNDIDAVNNPSWTGALPGSTNNTVTNYNDALLLWDSWQ